jgi:hypothetical protein
MIFGYYWGGQFKEGEVVRQYGMYGAEEKCIPGFVRKT